MKTITYNPETHKLVPIEPDYDILFAVVHAKNATRNGIKAPMTNEELASIYTAGINAAPAAEEEPQDSWANVPQEFRDWWNQEYKDSTNPFALDSAAYWAWAGWSAAKSAPAASDSTEEAPQREHDLKDVRCKCCGYLTHQREHMGCIRAAKQQPATHGEPEACETCEALARAVMMDQVSFDRKPDCYGIRQITDDEGVEEWEDIRTSPDVAREEANDMMATGRGEIYEVVPLYTSPQPTPELVQAARQALEALFIANFHVHHQEIIGAITELQNALKGTT